MRGRARAVVSAFVAALVSAAYAVPDANARAEVGHDAPPLSLSSLAGQTYDLATRAERFVVLVFFRGAW